MDIDLFTAAEIKINSILTDDYDTVLSELINLITKKLVNYTILLQLYYILLLKAMKF